MLLVAGLLAAGLLTGCGQQERPSATVTAPASHDYNRPASYAAPGPPGDSWGPWIRQAARRFDVPERWVREVMRQESGGRAGATSHAGAMGLMQVMPGTYRELRSRYGLGDDPYHPYDSIMAGTAYLREMYDLYGSPAFLAAYNAGPRRLEDYLWNSRGLPNETRNYVARIGPGVVGHHPARRAAPEVYAAAELPLYIPAGPRRVDGATMLALREQREATEPGIRPTVLAGVVRRMDPIPDGSTLAGSTFASSGAGGSALAATPLATPAPYQLAAIGPVVRMDPIPDGATPEGAARLAAASARAEAGLEAPSPGIAGGSTLAPTALAPTAAAPTALTPTALPQTARTVGASALVASALAAPISAGSARTALNQAAARYQAAAPAGAPQRSSVQLAAASAPILRLPSASYGGRGGLVPPGSAQVAAGRPGLGGLLGSARAASWPAAQRPGPAGGARTVQVGAFASPATARAAADAAARSALVGRGVRPVVEPVATPGAGTLYRARLTGLNSTTAQAVCDRARARGCAVVPAGRGKR